MVSERAHPHEQRRSRRYRHPLEVDLHERGGPRRLVAVDVGRHGLFLATDRPPPERHLVQLTLHLPTGPIRTAASVARTSTRNGGRSLVPGVGLQLFAMSEEAKERWDGFIQQLDAARSGDHARAPGPSATTSTSAPATPETTTATFLVKLKSLERLREFEREHVHGGGTVLYTPVLRAVGEPLSLVVVHPLTDEELRIPGVVAAVHTDRPKRLEIHFSTGPALREVFARFVATGRAPTDDDLAISIEADPDGASLEGVPPSELDFDVDVLAEGRVDDEGPLAPPEDLFLEVDDATPPSDEPRTGLAPTTFRLRCARASDGGCNAEPYTVELGPADGLLGLMADHRALWCPSCRRVVANLALAPAPARRARFAAFAARGSGGADTPVPLVFALEVADLQNPPACPRCGTTPRQSRTVDRLMASARRLRDGEAAARTKVRCGSCDRGVLVVEKASDGADEPAAHSASGQAPNEEAHETRT